MSGGAEGEGGCGSEGGGEQVEGAKGGDRRKECR